MAVVVNGILKKLVGQSNKIEPDIVYKWQYHADHVGGLAVVKTRNDLSRLFISYMINLFIIY